MMSDQFVCDLTNGRLLAKIVIVSDHIHPSGGFRGLGGCNPIAILRNTEELME